MNNSDTRLAPVTAPDNWEAADKAAMRLARKQNRRHIPLGQRGAATASPGSPPSCPDTPDHRLGGTALAFIPVARLRARADGWSQLAQEQFILALDAMGSVGPAARAVGRSRTSAYRLRDQDDHGSFSQAWDTAIDFGRMEQFSAAIERAMNGITTIRVRRGGDITVTGGGDVGLVRSLYTRPPGQPR